LEAQLPSSIDLFYMKKLAIIYFIIFVLAGMTALKASAIVFVPPVIYIATLSLGAFVVNVFAFFAVWFAAKGLIDRLYFGKPMHELIRLFFSLLGKFAILFIAAAVSVATLDPLNKKEVLAASVLAGVLGLVLIFLSSFREYRLEPKNKKVYFAGSMMFFSLVVFGVTYASALRALEIKILRIGGDNGPVEYQKKDALPGDISLPRQKAPSALPGVESDQGIAPSLQEQKAAERLGMVRKETQVLWFNPVDLTPCEIYFGGILVLSTVSHDNCYYNNDITTHRIICPVSIFREDVSVNLIKTIGDVVNIHGEGSCEERYNVIITEGGFIAAP
jgi:hypothetical protein